MREIKFRYWSPVSKRMVGWEEIIKLHTNTWANAKPLEVMQFTGLTDKAGVEIYEGDILSQIALYRDEKTEELFKVKWREGYGEFSYQSLGDIDNVSPCFQSGFVKVIGNIYEDSHLLENENPELLKENK